VIDEAGAFARMNRGEGEQAAKLINVRDIERVISKIARIPEKSVSSSEVEKLKDLEAELKKQIFGQDRAIEMVAAAIKKSRAGFNEPTKPIASFLFVGPPASARPSSRASSRSSWACRLSALTWASTRKSIRYRGLSARLPATWDTKREGC
jgi:hypothetical protein